MFLTAAPYQPSSATAYRAASMSHPDPNLKGLLYIMRGASSCGFSGGFMDKVQALLEQVPESAIPALASTLSANLTNLLSSEAGESACPVSPLSEAAVPATEAVPPEAAPQVVSAEASSSGGTASSTLVLSGKRPMEPESQPEKRPRLAPAAPSALPAVQGNTAQQLSQLAWVAHQLSGMDPPASAEAEPELRSLWERLCLAFDPVDDPWAPGWPWRPLPKEWGLNEVWAGVLSGLGRRLEHHIHNPGHLDMILPFLEIIDDTLRKVAPAQHAQAAIQPAVPYKPAASVAAPSAETGLASESPAAESAAPLAETGLASEPVAAAETPPPVAPAETPPPPAAETELPPESANPVASEAVAPPAAPATPESATRAAASEAPAAPAAPATPESATRAAEELANATSKRKRRAEPPQPTKRPTLTPPALPVPGTRIDPEQLQPGLFVRIFYKAVLDKCHKWREGEVLVVQGGGCWIKVSGRGTKYVFSRMAEVVVADNPENRTPATPAQSSQGDKPTAATATEATTATAATATAAATTATTATAATATTATASAAADSTLMSSALSRSLRLRYPTLHAEWQKLQVEKVRLQKALRDNPSLDRRALTEHLQKCRDMAQRARQAVHGGAAADQQALIAHGEEQEQALQVAEAALMQAAGAVQQARAKTPVMVELGTRGLEAEASLE